MNPRVSRSSALASKATGFPIAKIAARLAVGYALEEILNDITRATPASFEPTIDYVVVKWPRFAFEKFQGSDSSLTTQMKSVGEAMAIGRTFGQAFAKAMRSRELDAVPELDLPVDELLRRVAPAGPGALRRAARGAAAGGERRADPRGDADRPAGSCASSPSSPPTRRRRSRVCGRSSRSTRARRSSPRGRRTTTRPGSGRARTASRPTRWSGRRGRRSRRQSVVILGSGPNRIGQGIEFDYCCVHAAMTVR